MPRAPIGAEAAFSDALRTGGDALRTGAGASLKAAEGRSVEAIPRDLKILHVAETVRGGIATYLNEMHDLQVRDFGRGNVAYVVPAHHRTDLTQIPDEAVVTFASRGRGARSFVALAAAVLREVSQGRPDIVHLHSTFAGAVLRPILALMPGGPAVVYCPHGWSFSRQVPRVSQFATRMIERALAGLADQIVCISDSELEAARRARIDGGRLSLVPNGITLHRAGRDRSEPDGAGRGDKRLRVLFVGRFDRQKGYDFLIQAARELSEVIDVRFVGATVLGGDRMDDLPPNVAICGWMRRESIEDEYDWADVVVMPSRWEGFGLVGLEAMRAARPVVAFRTGALEQIVVDGVTGVLCPSSDAAGLVAGLRRVTTLDMTAMGRRGAQRFRDLFSVERTHEGLFKVYRAALARRRRNEAGSTVVTYP